MLFHEENIPHIKRKRMKWTSEKLDEALDLYKQGVRAAGIAKKLGTTRSSVEAIINKYQWRLINVRH